MIKIAHCLAYNPIDTKLKNLVAFLLGKFRVSSEGRFSNFYGVLLLALFLIAFKGSSGDGQPSLFSNLIRKYVVETSASMPVANVSHNQVADLTSLAVLQDMGQGRGGSEENLELSTIQDSSFVSNNPVSLDYINTGFGHNQVSEYTVQAGDVLSFIASDFGVSINSIIWANNLTNINSISPGQILRIPPVTGVIHKVKKGDTIVSISKKYGIDERKIVEFNRLSEGGNLAIDDEIIVPDGKIAASFMAKNQITTASRFAHLPDLGDYFFIPAAGHNWKRIHGRNGVDIANSCGIPIFAAADGTAVISDAVGWNGGFGKYVKLLHANGTETLYAHTSKLLISVGQFVQKGQEIALIGTTGRSTGCHLHFEVHGAKNPLAK